MDQTEPKQPFVPYIPSIPPEGRGRSASRVANHVRRYLAFYAGVTAFLLALPGEWLMRSPDAASVGIAPNSDLGMRLLQLAILLVVLVAWVRRGVMKQDSEPTTETAVLPLPVRRAVSRSPTDALTGSPPARAGFKRHFDAQRARLGSRGTRWGLLVVVLLAAVLITLLLFDNFSNPYAPWVWLAAMLALTLTFAGVRPTPGGRSLIPHDPGEPAVEPAVSRAEWLAVGAIMLAAILLRLWDLSNIPIGPYIDEASRGMDARAINLGRPVNGSPFVFFGTGWWGVPLLYFWVVAQSLKLLGDNLLAARLVHAFAGIATVWYVYKLGRVAWSPRAGLIAGTLAAFSDFAIHFSRTAGESAFTILTWTICLYYSYRGLKSRKSLDFVLSGLAAGFTLYSYATGKLLVLSLVPMAIYLLLRWGRTGTRRYLPGLMLMALAAALVYLPNALFIVKQKPGALAERSDVVSIFSPVNSNATLAQYNTDNWGIVVARQFALTYSAFDVGRERGPFYPTGQPLLPVPWAALWLLGTAYMVYRAGDARFGLLAIWLLAGLAGAALTNDTPTLQRVAGMMPLLMLVPAVFIDRVFHKVPRITLPGRAHFPGLILTPRAVNIVIAALVLALGMQTTLFYFGPYTAQAHYLDYAVAGRYLEKLDPQHDVVYQRGLPVMLGDSNPILFGARDVPLHDFSPDVKLPLTDMGGKNVHFMVSGADAQTLGAVQAYYPGGTLTEMKRPDGSLVVAAYEVSAQGLERQRNTIATYSPDGSPPIQRAEPRLGTLGMSTTTQPAPETPALAAYPATVEWAGGLLAPEYGQYHLNLFAPAGATLEIDGRALLTVSAGSQAFADVELALAKGIHRVRLAGKLANPGGQVELRWSVGNDPLMPVASRFLWDGPPGAFFCRSYADTPDPTWYTAEGTPAADASITTAQRDGFLLWPSSPGGGHSVCQGMLDARQEGDYSFDAAGIGVGAIWLDAKLLGAQGSSDTGHPLPATVHLAAGQHSIELRYGAAPPGAGVALYWQPPGGQRQPLPPFVLAPIDGGAWIASDLPGAPFLDPALVRLGEK